MYQRLAVTKIPLTSLGVRGLEKLVKGMKIGEKKTNRSIG